ncbi:MAG: hypothetical protein PGN07_09295 [Aeromicrobium erythreum]
MISPSLPWSKTDTTLRWFSLAADRASRSKRWVNCSVVAEAVVHDLDRDLAVEPLVGAVEDAGHATPGDARVDPVAPVEDAPDQGFVAHHRHAGLLEVVGGRTAPARF